MPAWGPILAATDFSTAARHAADRAARLAHEAGAELSLMHVLPGGALQELRQWLGAGSLTEQQLQAEARALLQRQGAELQAVHGVPVRSVEAAGSAVDEIVREAETLDAALLVLGARGQGFLRRLILGTTSERLLPRTKRPLLVVRQTPHRAYRRVLLALDFSPWSRGAVALARCIAPQAHLVLLNAWQVPFEGKLHFAGVTAATIDGYRRRARADATSRLHELATAAGLSAGQWTPCLVEGEASLAIAEQEQQHDCDLVVLGKHGRSVTEDLLLGSVTRHVLAEGQADVLVSTAHRP
ncbi:MAG TPA: universal stress protein [Rubrivivax sp.]|nr:universal stress protein [Rubrivivax sp.]